MYQLSTISPLTLHKSSIMAIRVSMSITMEKEENLVLKQESTTVLNIHNGS